MLFRSLKRPPSEDDDFAQKFKSSSGIRSPQFPLWFVAQPKKDPFPPFIDESGKRYVEAEVEVPGTPEQVWQVSDIADGLDIPVLCYGLRTDFQGKLFPGSAALLGIADDLTELKTICHCGRKATMNLRVDAQGRGVREGAQVEIGEIGRAHV